VDAITQMEIDQHVFDLYDEYWHGGIDRREFLRRAAALGALGFALSLLPDYARADRSAHQRDVAGLREGVGGGGRALRGAHLPGR
jgi:carboxymethylenebutenolidase